MGSERASFYTAFVLIGAGGFRKMAIAGTDFIVVVKFLPINRAEKGNVKHCDGFNMTIDY